MQQLIDQAECDLAEGNLQAALGGYLRALASDPSEPFAWCRTAMVLVMLFGDEEALQALEAAAEAAANSGNLLVAIAAQRELAAREPERADVLAGSIAALYGSGSSRLDRDRRAVPPPTPRAIRETTSVDASVVADDLRVLREEALDACQRASGVRRHADRLPFYPLFCDLPSGDLSRLLSLVGVRQIREGEEVITQGAEQERSFYVLVRGRVVVLRDDLQLARLRDGAFFGEMALLTESPRTATVRCETPSLALCFERETVEELAATNPEIAAVLADYTRRRLLRNLMATSELFAPLPLQRRQALVSLFTAYVFESGDVVLSEGDEADGLFVVLSGSVTISKQEAGETLTLAEMNAGDVFGEISLIQRTPATATVAASSKTVVLMLSRDAFNERVGEYPEVLTHIYKLAQQRQQHTAQAEKTAAIPVGEDLLV